LLAPLPALVACATLSRTADAPAQKSAGEGECLRAAGLSQWEPLSDRELLVWPLGSTRAHLLRLATAIPGMADAGELEVVDTDLNGWICPDGRDAILVEECNCGSASIASIEYLSEKRTAELLLETGPAQRI
jgi:hypothetical protein